MLGVVLNKASLRGAGAITQGYGYGYQAEETPPVAPVKVVRGRRKGGD